MIRLVRACQQIRTGQAWRHPTPVAVHCFVKHPLHAACRCCCLSTEGAADLFLAICCHACQRCHPEHGLQDPIPHPNLPAGFTGQFILVVPDRDLVIVRLGFNPDDEDSDRLAAGVLGNVSAAVKPRP